MGSHNQYKSGHILQWSTINSHEKENIKINWLTVTFLKASAERHSKTAPHRSISDPSSKMFDSAST